MRSGFSLQSSLVGGRKRGPRVRFWMGTSTTTSLSIFVCLFVCFFFFFFFFFFVVFLFFFGLLAVGSFVEKERMNKIK